MLLHSKGNNTIKKGAYGLEENILISDKELISKICKELHNCKKTKQTTKTNN